MKWLALSALPLAALAALGAEGPPPGAAGGFVGSTRCIECHQRLHERWANARHGKMIQPATAAAVKGDFRRGSIDLRGRRYALREKDGAFFISESYLSGRERERRIDYTLGSRRIQHYLTTLEDGRIVVLPPSWDVERRQWFHNLEIVDPEETAATKVQVWNTNCFGCHVSGEQKNYDPVRKTYATGWTDFGTNCERCHGPGETHSAWHAANAREGAAAPPPAVMVRPTRLGAEKETMVCAQCHSLRDVTAAGFTAGAEYDDHFMPILEYAQKVDHDPAYWPDGRPRRFSNDALGLWQSRCYLKGGLTCTGCHVDPHEPDVDRNPQLSATNDALCTRCHEQISLARAQHTRHDPSGAGSRCIECHMPRTVLSIKAKIRDHSISVPAPENTVRFGIPNACNECHRDRTPEWAVQALAGWGGRGREGLVRRAEAFAGGRRGDPAALPPLLALAADAAEPPLVRANALGHLRHYRGDAASAAAVQALGDEAPLVRAVAALTLAESPLPANGRERLVHALADARRVVRVAAAFALANKGVTRLEGEDGRRLEQGRAEYALRAEQLTDDADTQLNLGKFHFVGGDYPRAAHAFEDALRLDPAQPGGRYFLGAARVGEGRVRDARALLRQVARSDPYHEAARTLLAKLEAAVQEER
ncbi:MAG TPA: tetratricopeptide repeat protein [Vicinamibacteria bacterium]|nr:tetratricopeptide repeat protein [Vicinamibacteria bacterium]